MPRQNSIAVNTGNPSGSSSGGEDPGACPTTDQRGESRVLTVSDSCDVGAVEFKESDIDVTSFYIIPLPDGKVVVVPL